MFPFNSSKTKLNSIINQFYSPQILGRISLWSFQMELFIKVLCVLLNLLCFNAQTHLMDHVSHVVPMTLFLKVEFAVYANRNINSFKICVFRRLVGILQLTQMKNVMMGTRKVGMDVLQCAWLMKIGFVKVNQVFVKSLKNQLKSLIKSLILKNLEVY